MNQENYVQTETIARKKMDQKVLPKSNFKLCV